MHGQQSDDRKQSRRCEIPLQGCGIRELSLRSHRQNEQELMPQIERHGREAHGIEQIDQQTRNKVKDAIRPAA